MLKPKSVLTARHDASWLNTSDRILDGGTIDRAPPSPSLLAQFIFVWRCHRTTRGNPYMFVQYVRRNPARFRYSVTRGGCVWCVQERDFCRFPLFFFQRQRSLTAAAEPVPIAS